MAAQPPVARYALALIVLHWLLAVMVIGLLAIGFLVLALTPNDAPREIAVLRIHMMGGMFVLALTVVRLLVRLFTRRPPEGRRAWLHLAFYAVTIAMSVSGFATGWAAGLPGILWAGTGDPMPADFTAYPTFIAHMLLGAGLTAMIAWHVWGALKGRVLRRMWFSTPRG